MNKFRIIVMIIISLLLISCNKGGLKYNCTLEQWNQFEELLNQYNIEDSLMVEFDALVDYNYVDMTCVVINDPVYFEIDINSNRSAIETHQIIKCIDGEYFSFEVDDFDKTIKATQIDLDSYNFEESLSMYNEVMRSADESMELDYKKVELIELADRKFQIRCKLADIPGFTETIKEYEIEQYAPNFNETILTIIFTLDDDWLQMEMNTKINLYLVDRNYIFPISMKYKFYFNGVSELDTTEYRIEPPRRFEDILEETPISHIPLYRDCDSYLYCYFDAGYYYLNAADDNSKTIKLDYARIELYDEKYQIIDYKDFPVLWTNTRRLIHVQKSGYYYVYLERNDSIPTQDKSVDFYVLFDKINIEEEKEVKVLQSAKGELTWMFDYECFRYESSDKDSIIKITNNLTKPLTVYAIYDLSYTKFKDKKILEGNDNFWTFNPREDEPFDLYLIPSRNPYTQQIDIFEYDFTVEIIQNKNGTDLNELSLITDDYQEEYLFGPGYERYVILDVKEAGIYVFYVKYNDELTASLHVRINNSNYSYSSYNFKPGKYVLKFAPEGNIYNGCIVQVKYVYLGDLE